MSKRNKTKFDFIWVFEGESCTLIGKRKYRLLLLKLFEGRPEISTFIKNDGKENS